MPIRLRHNAALEVSRVEYFGAMAISDLEANAAFNAANPEYLGYDCLSIIRADIDVAGLSLSDLESILNTHHTLFEPLDLMILRRSAWICENAPAQRLLTHWFATREQKRSTHAVLRQFETHDDVAEWFLLDADGARQLRSGEGFTEIATFGVSGALSR